MPSIPTTSTGTGTTAKSLEGGTQIPSDRVLAKHTSSLPNFLYFLSFAPPIPAVWRDPAGFFTHPWVLYALAIPGAIVSGVALPAFDIVLGYWSQVIQDPASAPGAITDRGNEAGWIMAIIAAAFILGYAAMFVCCMLTDCPLRHS
jgi:ATP-binding cassette subfamily B (MDR/TAP) protein 1